jgi:hypothetical protein
MHEAKKGNYNKIYATPQWLNLGGGKPHIIYYSQFIFIPRWEGHGMPHLGSCDCIRGE